PPADCNDHLECTRDIVVGAGCKLECRHEEIVDVAPGDRCCPTGGSAATDPDCSATCGNGALDPGEACDTALPPGNPNSCPDAARCDDQDPCTRDGLVSAGTCAAVCVHQPILAPAAGDGCCPLSASTETDSDCPAVCGNGRVDKPAAESCDRGLRTPDPSCPETCRSCPESCPDDGNPCTTDVLV